MSISTGSVEHECGDTHPEKGRKMNSKVITGIIAISIILAVLIGYVDIQRQEMILEEDCSTNGEQIYFTGVNERGEAIKFNGGPMWLSMHGGSCVSCHGIDGRGGLNVMMGTETPSDIRYKALTEGHEEGEHPPYTDELIRRAVREGLNPAGEVLDPTMPRWSISDEDLDDLIEYLKVLSSK